MSQRVLIVGTDGLVGRALLNASRAAGFTAFGTTRRIPHVTQSNLFLDLAQVNYIRNAHLPEVDIAFICAAMTGFAECRQQPENASAVNVIAPSILAERLAAQGTRTILLSSSAALDCAEPYMKAERPRNATSAYGVASAQSEEAILKIQGGTILRLTKVLVPENALFSTWRHTLRNGGSIEAFDDHGISPLLPSHVTDALLKLCCTSEAGIFQISGAGDISYFEAACLLACMHGVPTSRVQACSAISKGIPETERTRYTSLDTERMTRLSGFVPPGPQALITQLYAPEARH